MAHLDAARNVEGLAAAGARVSGAGLREAAPRLDLRVAPLDETGDVPVAPAGSGDGVHGVADGVVAHDPHGLGGELVRPDVADRSSGGLFDLVLGGQCQVVHLEHVLEGNLVDLEVAPEQRDDEAPLGLVDEALDHPRRRDAEELDDVVDAALARRFDLDQRRLGLVLPGRGPRTRFGLLEVRPVAARGASDDGVLARVGEHHELLGRGAADRARVGLHDREIQAAAPEDLAVGRVLRLVRAVEPLGVHVEGVTVVHQELAPAHEPEPRPDLVAELGPDLVQRHRKLAVGRHARAHHRRDGLLGRRREAVLAALAVLEVEEELLLHVARPAAALLPELSRLQDGQLHLETAGAVDLLAHDLLGFPVGPQAQGRQRVEAAGEAPDHPRAAEENVRDGVGVAGHLTDGLQEITTPTHRWTGGYRR